MHLKPGDVLYLPGGTIHEASMPPQRRRGDARDRNNKANGKKAEGDGGDAAEGGGGGRTGDGGSASSTGAAGDGAGDGSSGMKKRWAGVKGLDGDHDDDDGTNDDDDAAAAANGSTTSSYSTHITVSIGRKEHMRVNQKRRPPRKCLK